MGRVRAFVAVTMGGSWRAPRSERALLWPRGG